MLPIFFPENFIMPEAVLLNLLFSGIIFAYYIRRCDLCEKIFPPERFVRI